MIAAFAIFAMVAVCFVLTDESDIKADYNPDAVAEVGGIQYETLDEAFAALNDDNYELTLLGDEAKQETTWPTSTPAHYSVTDADGNDLGSGYSTTLRSALIDGYKCGTAGEEQYITIVCRPGAELGDLTHGHVADNLTIYGNGAYVKGGEQELELDTYIYNRSTGDYVGIGSEIAGDLMIKVYQVDNLGAWGTRISDYTLTFDFFDCNGRGDTAAQRFLFTDVHGKNIIILRNCTFIESSTGTVVSSNNISEISVIGCKYSSVALPISVSNDTNGESKLLVKDTEFESCSNVSTPKYDSTYMAPIRLVSESLGGQISATVDNCKFTYGVDASVNGDIIIGDYRSGKTKLGINNLTLIDTAAKVTSVLPVSSGKPIYKSTMDIASSSTPTFINQADAFVRDTTDLANALAAISAMTYDFGDTANDFGIVFVGDSFDISGCTFKASANVNIIFSQWKESTVINVTGNGFVIQNAGNGISGRVQFDGLNFSLGTDSKAIVANDSSAIVQVSNCSFTGTDRTATAVSGVDSMIVSIWSCECEKLLSLASGSFLDLYVEEVMLSDSYHFITNDKTDGVTTVVKGNVSIVKSGDESFAIKVGGKKLDVSGTAFVFDGASVSGDVNAFVVIVSDSDSVWVQKCTFAGRPSGMFDVWSEAEVYLNGSIALDRSTQRYQYNFSGYTFTLDYGQGITKQYQVMYKNDMPAAEKPDARMGYTFKGFINPSTSVMYYDSEMNSLRTWDIASDDVVLSAVWVQNAVYSITYDVNGATGPAPEDVHGIMPYTKVTLAVPSSELTRGEEYSFTGWSDGYKIYAAGSEYTLGQASVEFKAVWAKNYVEPVKGTGDAEFHITALDSQGTAVDIEGATVTIYGYTSAETDSVGYVKFTGITEGTYNAEIAYKNNYTKSVAITIVAGESSYNEMELDFTVSTAVEVTEASDISMAVGNLESVASELKEATDSANVELKVVINNSTDAAISYDQEIGHMKDMTGAEECMFFDASLWLTTEDEASMLSTQITDIGDSVLELIIPFNKTGKTNIGVHSFHDDGTDGEYITFVLNDTGAAGTYSFDDNGNIHIFTNRFSAYTITFDADGIEKPVVEPATIGIAVMCFIGLILVFLTVYTSYDYSRRQ